MFLHMFARPQNVRSNTTKTFVFGNETQARMISGLDPQLQHTADQL